MNDVVVDPWYRSAKLSKSSYGYGQGGSRYDDRHYPGSYHEFEVQGSRPKSATKASTATKTTTTRSGTRNASNRVRSNIRNNYADIQEACRERLNRAGANAQVREVRERLTNLSRRYVNTVERESRGRTDVEKGLARQAKPWTYAF